MFKKILRMAMTFALLVIAYGGYSRGFAILADFVAKPRTVPKLPIVATKSDSFNEATDLAVAAFGPGHWAVTAPFRWYDESRGQWIFWRDHVRLEEGKTWEFKPVAVIIRSAKSRELKTIVGDHAVLDFNRPFDVSKPGDDAAYVTHARIDGNVRIRADKGTSNIADDLAIGPLDSLEFDEKREEIISRSEKPILLVEKGTTIRGVGLLMNLRRHATRSTPLIELPTSVTPGSGFEGVRRITLLHDVTIDVQDVGRSGIVPGGTQVTTTTAKDGKKTVTKSEPRPGHIQCTAAMTIDLPRGRKNPLIGPPAPSEPTIANFDRNVRVQQGRDANLDQMDSDHLEALLYPTEPGDKESKASVANETDKTAKRTADVKLAGISGGATTKDQPKAESASGEQEEGEGGGGSLSNLTLRRAKATGHAVWLQSTEQRMVGQGNLLIYEKFGNLEPDRIFFHGERETEVVKTEVARTGKDAGKPQYIDTILAKDFTIYRYPPGGLAPIIIARGPGTQETRAVGGDVVERFASWNDEMRVLPVVGSDDRKIILVGHPRVRSRTQGDMSADDIIIADLEPKANAVAKATPPSFAATLDRDTSKPRETMPSTGGNSMRLKHVEAKGNVLLIAEAILADPTAKPPKQGSPRREIRARQMLTANFVDGPKGESVVIVKPTEVAIKPENAPAATVAETDPNAKKPLAPAPEPTMTAIADTVTAEILRKEGSDSGQVQDAKLIGRAEVHQDPKNGETQGSDFKGETIFLKNGGINRMNIQAHAKDGEWAEAVTPGQSIWGPIINFDQGSDHGWVNGWGRLEMEGGDTDFLDDSSAIHTATADDKAKTPEPKKKKGPVVIHWGTDAKDKKAQMHFHGRTVNPDGTPGPAVAKFYSKVRVRSEDSSADCEILTATFDQPIPFVRVKTDPAEEKLLKARGEKKKGPQIATVLCDKNPVVIARKFDPVTGVFKDKKHITNGDSIYFDKLTGEFTAPAPGRKNVPGEVYLYSTNSDEEKDPKPGSLAADRRTVKPASTRGDAVKKTAKPLEIKLTHVVYQKKMEGRFAAPKDAKPGEYSNVYFNGSVETMMANVKDEYGKLDPDNPPDDFYRLVSKEMTVNVEPPPVKEKGAKDRILLDAWGEPQAQTRQKTILGDRITYDSLSELTYVYGDERDVQIQNQDGAGQPGTKGRSKAVMHNHITGVTELIDPKTFEIVMPSEKTNRSALVPYYGQPKSVAGLAAPGRPVKPYDANDPATRARQLKLPPRSDKERRSYNGR